MRQERFSKNAFASARVESGLTAVIEEDTVDDQSSDERRDTDKSLDIRDLLLDETD
jgi:hypothetical protein